MAGSSNLASQARPRATHSPMDSPEHDRHHTIIRSLH